MLSSKDRSRVQAEDEAQLLPPHTLLPSASVQGSGGMFRAPQPCTSAATKASAAGLVRNMSISNISEASSCSASGLSAGDYKRVSTGNDEYSNTAQPPIRLSLNEAIDLAGFGKFQLLLMLMCGLCWAADAMEAMLLSFLLPEVTREWSLSKGAVGALGAIVFLGIFIGSYAWGVMSDQYGRRVGYMATALFTAVFGLLSSFSGTYVVLLSLRFLVGIGLGGAVVAYTLFSEVLPTEARARCLLLHYLFWTFGALFEVLLAWILIPYSGWQGLLFWSSIPIFGVLLLWRYLPESPRFLLHKGLRPEAEKLVSQIHNTNRSALANTPIHLAHLPPHAPPTIGQPLRKLLSPALRVTSLLVFWLWFVDSAAYYGFSFVTPRFFPLGSSTEYISMLISTLAEFPGLLIPAVVIDYWGRRRTLALCYTCAGIAGLFLAVPGMTGGLETLMLFIARGTISGAFVTTYIYTTEVYPTSVRATGMGVASSMSRVAGMATSFISQDLNPVTACVIFAFLSLSGALAAHSLPIETAHRDLQDEVISCDREIVRPSPGTRSSDSASHLRRSRSAPASCRRLKLSTSDRLQEARNRCVQASRKPYMALAIVHNSVAAFTIVLAAR